MKTQSRMTCYSDLIGLEFEYGGRGPKVYDCWGLVQECMRRWNGTNLPDYRSTSSVKENAAIMQSEGKRLWRRVPLVEPGTVILMSVNGLGSHVGFVHSNTRFIQALERLGVIESRITQFKRQIIGAYEYVG